MNDKEEIKVINKPIGVVRNELINNITRDINDSKLPLFIIEYVLKDLLVDISNMSASQIEFERRQYEQLIKKQTTNKNDG